MSRKTASFAQLYDYITQAKDGPKIALAHNLPCPSVDRAAVLKAFFDTDRLSRPRKNGVRVFHEVLAFHPGDAEALTLSAMRDLAEFYLHLRAPRGIALAEVHFDQAHPHVHLMISANEAGSGRKIRLSRRAFSKIKERLEAFQKARFPELTQSLCQPDPNRQPALPFRVAASFAANLQEFAARLATSPFRRNIIVSPAPSTGIHQMNPLREFVLQSLCYA